MSNNLKKKTVDSFFWSIVDNLFNLIINFTFGIILARLLSPREFGLIGMITVFIAIAQTFIDIGFTQALIRKQECTQADYSTVFFVNLFVGIFFFLILIITAGPISLFLNEPQLKPLVQGLSFVLIINSLIIIQKTQLIKELNFKLQTKISLLAALISGITSVTFAVLGFGVWSLVVKTIVYFIISAILFWNWSSWRPLLIFSKKSFKELFSFGYKLLLSGLINTIFQNIYSLVIGKYFSAVQLGFYTRADQFQALPSQNITNVIQRVSYPVLSEIQDDKIKLKAAYKRLIRSSTLIIFVLMMGMASVARPMVLTLIGEKWEPCVIYLQMLCFVGMFYPLQALNLNMLQVQGRSDLFLRLEIIKKSLAIPVIAVGVFFGIKAMIIGLMLLTVISYYLNSYWSGRYIGYSFFEQIKDILPSFLLAVIMSSVVFLEGLLISLPPLVLLIIQLITGAIITFGISEAIQFRDYIYIKNIVKEKILTLKKDDK